MTANWESTLKDISEKGHRIRQNEFIDSIKQYIKQMINSDNKLLKLRAMTKYRKRLNNLQFVIVLNVLTEELRSY